MIGLLEYRVQDFDKVVYQASEEILLNKSQCDLLEGLGALGIVVSSLAIFLFHEELVCVDSCDIGLLAALAVVEGLADMASLEVLLPGISALILQL